MIGHQGLHPGIHPKILAQVEQDLEAQEVLAESRKERAPRHTLVGIERRVRHAHLRKEPLYGRGVVSTETQMAGMVQERRERVLARRERRGDEQGAAIGLDEGGRAMGQPPRRERRRDREGGARDERQEAFVLGGAEPGEDRHQGLIAIGTLQAEIRLAAQAPGFQDVGPAPQPAIERAGPEERADPDRAGKRERGRKAAVGGKRAERLQDLGDAGEAAAGGEVGNGDPKKGFGVFRVRASPRDPGGPPATAALDTQLPHRRGEAVEVGDQGLPCPPDRKEIPRLFDPKVGRAQVCGKPGACPQEGLAGLAVIEEKVPPGLGPKGDGRAPAGLHGRQRRAEIAVGDEAQVLQLVQDERKARPGIPRHAAWRCAFTISRKAMASSMSSVRGLTSAASPAASGGRPALMSEPA